MRLLHIVSSLNPAAGGVSQAILTIIKGLTQQGIVSEVVTIDDPSAAFLATLPFPVYPKGPGKTAWQYAPPFLHWLRQHLHGYDTVIVHGLWQYPTYGTYKAWTGIEEKRPKLFVMPHGMLDPYFQKAKGRKMKALRNRIFWKWNEQKLVNAADALLFTCETEMLLAREPFAPYRPKVERVVGLGVEAPPAFTIAMKTAFEEKLEANLPAYWLFISRIHEKKGVDLLINAYLELKKAQSGIPPLVIAGPGLDTPFGSEMRQLAGPGSNIYFPGMLTGNAKWGAFYGCEVFILPSHQENFGIAVVEALACGKPVLISNQVNIWREIVENKGGFATADNPEGASALLSLWLNLTSEQRASTGENALQVYQQFFSEETAAQKLTAVLQA